MSAEGPIYRLDLTRADLLLLVEAIMCATSSDQPGLAEAARMREIGLSLQRILRREGNLEGNLETAAEAG